MQKRNKIRKKLDNVLKDLEAEKRVFDYFKDKNLELDMLNLAGFIELEDGFYSLTLQGWLIVAKGGFQKEYRRNNLVYITSLLASLSALLALGFSIYTLFIHNK